MLKHTRPHQFGSIDSLIWTRLAFTVNLGKQKHYTVRNTKVLNAVATKEETCVWRCKHLKQGHTHKSLRSIGLNIHTIQRFAGVLLQPMNGQSVLEWFCQIHWFEAGPNGSGVVSSTTTTTTSRFQLPQLPKGFSQKGHRSTDDCPSTDPATLVTTRSRRLRKVISLHGVTEVISPVKTVRKDE